MSVTGMQYQSVYVADRVAYVFRGKPLYSYCACSTATFQIKTSLSLK